MSHNTKQPKRISVEQSDTYKDLLAIDLDSVSRNRPVLEVLRYSPIGPRASNQTIPLALPRSLSIHYMRY